MKLEEPISFGNPPDRLITIFGTIGSILFNILVLYLYIIFPSTTLIMVGLLLLLFLLIVIWWSQYFNKPKTVRIEESGIRLFYRYKAPKFIPFSNINSVLVNNVDGDSAVDKLTSSGAIFINGKYYPILVSAEIAIEVKKRYQ